MVSNENRSVESISHSKYESKYLLRENNSKIFNGRCEWSFVKIVQSFNHSVHKPQTKIITVFSSQCGQLVLGHNPWGLHSNITSMANSFATKHDYETGAMLSAFCRQFSVVTHIQWLLSLLWELEHSTPQCESCAEGGRREAGSRERLAPRCVLFLESACLFGGRAFSDGARCFSKRTTHWLISCNFWRHFWT